MVAGIRERAARSTIGEGPYVRKKIPRRRVGNAFLNLAKEAEKEGLLSIAAGLRAADKWAWGRQLTQEEEALVAEARKWVKGDRRQSLLAGLPDPPTSEQLALIRCCPQSVMEFLQYHLRLALLCWPEGFASPPSPDSPPTE